MRISDWSSDVCSSDLQHLNFNVTRAFDKFLDEYAIVAEACQAFPLHAFKTLANVLLAPGETHSLTAAAGRSLHHHRIAYVGFEADCMSGGFNFHHEAGEERDSRLLSHQLRFTLLAPRCNGYWR